MAADSSTVVSAIHGKLAGTSIDFDRLDVSKIAPALLERARATWAERASTEHRSIEVMTRFLVELQGAGEPIEMYAGTLELIEDEIRHTALCRAMCRALGGSVPADRPTAEVAAGLQRAPMNERALATAIAMLAVNETMSVGYIRDLAARCENPVVGAVLRATVEDEDEHEAFGWTYIATALDRFPKATHPEWRAFTRRVVQPHLDHAGRALAAVAPEERELARFPDSELIDLGLMSQEREALVGLATFQRELEPRLSKLGLW